MLNVVTPEQAEIIILENTETGVESELVGLYDCLGRTAAEDVISPENLPCFSRSGVDGLAVHSRDTFGCNESMPSMLEYAGKILMGEEVSASLKDGFCMEIPTGGMLPQGADAAVMVEYTENIGDGFRYVQKPCAPLENVISLGDDCKTGETVLRHSTVIQPRHIALLAALGISEIKATLPPRVGIISTGDELVDFSRKPLFSQVRDVNSVTLYASAVDLGCEVKVYPIVRDYEDELLSAVKTAIRQCDCLLISGGSSVGERDAVCKVLSKVGEIKFHGIAVKPGKPTLFAVLDGKPVFGLPGHPAAAFFAFHLFVKPALCKIKGAIHKSNTILAIAAQNIPSNHGRQEVLAVRIENGTAIPLFAKSGTVSALSKADGYIVIDRNTEGILQGDTVEVTLF